VVEPYVASKVRKKRTSNGTGYVRLRVTLKVEQGNSQVGEFDVCTTVRIIMC
jgi:acyl dehydratase